VSEFWIEQTDNEGPWGDGSWVVWHKPDGVEAGTVDDYEIVALCETEKVAEATITGLLAEPAMKEQTEDEKARRGAYIVAARERYAHGSDDDIEVNDSACVAPGGEGAFVQAWVWVRNDELPLEE